MGIHPITSKNNAAIRSAHEPPPRTVKYPSYKSFDAYVDVAKLRSLDTYLRRRMESHVIADRDDFFLNRHVLSRDAPVRPGVREIWLTRTLPGTPYNYLDISRPDLWSRTPEAAEFALLLELIETLPFQSTGWILLIYDAGGHTVPAHRDHESTDVCHDFIWLRTNLKKPFYLLDPISSEKLYVEGYTAWFDTVNQYHGSDRADGLTFSIRVDGHFEPEFRKQIPDPGANKAAAPAVWAAQCGGLQ